MKYEKTILFSVAFMTCMGLAAPAYAYFDPGTAGIILQMAIGSIFVGLVAVKLYWQRFLALFTRHGKVPKTPEASNESQDMD